MIFVDRIEETKQIIRYTKDIKESSILLIYAKTGVGKSTLTQKFMEVECAENENIKTVRVFTNKINSNNTVNGDFLFNIFNAIRKTDLPSKKYSFDYYISHHKNPTHRKYVLEKILDDAKSNSTFKELSIKTLGAFIIKRCLKLSEYNYEKLLNDYTYQTFQIVSGYIEYVLKNIRMIINIDNIQNIDDISFKYIIEWITHLRDKKHLFLFEYTINDETRQKVLQFRDNVQQLGVSIDLLELNNMDSEYAIEAAKNNTFQDCGNTKNDVPNEVIDYYNAIDGNIRSLEDFIRQYNKSNSHKISYTPLIDVFNALSENERTILCAICLNSAEINVLELKYIFKDCKFDLKNCINSLEKNYALIENKGNILSIKHASIYDEWKTTNNTKIYKSNIIAYDYLKKHYENIIETIEHNKNAKAFISLLKLYSTYEPDKVFDVFNNFDDSIRGFVTPEQLNEYIINIDKEIHMNAKAFVDFYYRMIDLCLETRLFKLANHLLLRIEEYSEPAKFIFYYCNILYQSEQHSESVKFINDAIKYTDNEYFIMYLRLFLLIAYRSLNDYKNVEIINNTIALNIEKYKNTLFYAFYLRLSELRKLRIDAIKDVENSISLFEKMNLEIQTAKSRVALSFLYGVTGRISDAFEQTNKAEKTIVKEIAHKHIFFNNKAALYMLKGDFSTNVWSMLDTAELTALATFDKLAIYNNKLVYSIESLDWISAKLEKNKICKLLELETDKHIVAIIYYNLYLYYKNVKDVSNSERCLAKCHSLKAHCRSLNARLTGTTTGDGTDILLSNPWHVCFLDYWDLDYLEDLENHS